MRSPLMICFVLTVAVACHDQGTSYKGNPFGKFSYTAYDTLGNAIYSGSLVLYQEGTEITGYWEFQDGRSGDLDGTIQGTEMSLNLNPGFIDNNLLLHGTLSGNTYSGVWQQVGFPGIMDQGSFTAVKQ